MFAFEDSHDDIVIAHVFVKHELVVQGGFLKVQPQSLKISSQHGWRLEQGTPKL
jgi:F0F1-type ATP synthase epsilon subunit